MATKEEMALALTALENGYLTRAQIQRALDLQKERLEQRRPAPLFDIVVQEGYLSEVRARKLWYYHAAVEGSASGTEPIEGYRIKAKRAEGGMATVFEAVWPAYECPVALKILRPRHRHDSRLVKSFLNEARLLCYLDHPSIVKGYQYGRSNGLFFLAMEFVAGASVQEMIEKRGPMPPGQVLELARRTAEALAYLDRHGIVHRDIKPANILVDGRGRMALCDFGLARRISEKDYLQAEGVTCGTLEYLSPEQALGKELDIRSDLYSLGVSLYQMLTGELPFQGSRSEVMAQAATGSFEKVARGKVPESLYPLLCRMMAGKKENRPSPDALLAETREAAVAPDLRPCAPAVDIPQTHDAEGADIHRKMRTYQRSGKFRRTVGLRKMSPEKGSHGADPPE